MRRLGCLLLLAASAPAQTSRDATELLAKVKVFAETTKSWKAEARYTSRSIISPNLVLKDGVHISVAAQPLHKMSRVNSGDDKTVMVCDGTDFFYSGDGHSYEKSRATQQCDLSLISLYEPSILSLYAIQHGPDSLSIVGEDHVRLTEGDRRCVIVRAVSWRETMNEVRTMCIDTSSPIILRDTFETEDYKTGNKAVTETTIISFEKDPKFAPDRFKISIPAGAADIQAKPPLQSPSTTR